MTIFSPDVPRTLIALSMWFPWICVYRRTIAKVLWPDKREAARAPINNVFTDAQRKGQLTLQHQNIAKGVREAGAAPERKIMKGPNGKPRFVDSGGLVFPNVEQENTYDWKADSKLRKEWTGLPAVRNFNKQTSAFGRIVASAKDPSPAGDLSMIFNFMKVLDPGSVVRESEFATAQNSGAVPDRIRDLYNRVLNGFRLTPTQRQDFANRGKRLYQEAEREYLSRRDQYSKIAKARKLNPEFALPDFRRTGEIPEYPAPGTVESGGASVRNKNQTQFQTAPQQPQRAANPQTGEVLELQNGQWLPAR